jgi:hypothetical protein
MLSVSVRVALVASFVVASSATVRPKNCPSTGSVCSSA